MSNKKNKQTERKIKILLIEDDPYLLSMYSMKFELEGFIVVSGSDGDVGLHLALNEADVDIILLDILIPKMNGFEVLENLKANEKTKNTPIILLTNLNQKDEIERGLGLGADDYLIKAHFMPSEVVDKIKKVLNK